jgi:hypothetical protein
MSAGCWLVRSAVLISGLAATIAFAIARPMFNGRFTPLSIWIPRESTRDPS